MFPPIVFPQGVIRRRSLHRKSDAAEGKLAPADLLRWSDRHTNARKVYGCPGFQALSVATPSKREVPKLRARSSLNVAYSPWNRLRIAIDTFAN